VEETEGNQFSPTNFFLFSAGMMDRSAELQDRGSQVLGYK
jgi:hypothetical protein